MSARVSQLKYRDGHTSTVSLTAITLAWYGEGFEAEGVAVMSLRRELQTSELTGSTGERKRRDEMPL